MQNKLILFLVIAVVFLALRAWEFSTERRIKNNVRCCEEETLGQFMYWLRCELPETYRISIKEEPDLCRVLEDYRVYVAKTFIKDGYSNKCASMSAQMFFMTSLHVFLSKRSCFYELDGRCITEYSGPVNEYTNRYNLTDFGVVFYKALLAAEIYMKKINEPLADVDYLCSVLNTREIKTMTYMP